MDFVSVPVLGYALVILGPALFLWREKRKYGRTNSAGVEEFRSFGAKMGATAFDGLLSWLSMAFLGIGLLILAFV